MSNELLAELNAFRVNEGKDAFKDWRKARHMPMLEQYRADLEAEEEHARGEDEFEASADELAAQVGRESADVARDEALVVSTSQAVQKMGRVARVKTERHGEHVETVTPVKGGVVINTEAVSYKTMTRHEKSQVAKPFAIIHAYLDANPSLKRKDAVAALVDQGINFYTARTQYQRWFKKQKGE